MTPRTMLNEGEVRRALEARSGEMSPEFRARLSGALQGGRPATNPMPAAAVAMAIILALGSVGVLLMARGASRASHQGPVIVTSPSPTPTIVQKTPIYVPLFNQLSAPSSNVVWALVAAGGLYRSTDRGNTWEQRALPPIQAGGNPDFSFINAQEGWFLIGGADEPQCYEGRAQIWHTTDGAATWQRVAVETWTLSHISDSVGGETCKQGLSFSDPLHGYISAWAENRHPIIYRTLDGGRNWAGATLADPPGFVTQIGVNLRPGSVRAFGSALLVYAWGELPGEWMPSVYVFRSTDRGATWSYLARNWDIAFHSVTFVTTSRWLQIGNQVSVQETTDAGKTWHSFASDYAEAAGVPSVVVFGDELVGYGTVRGGFYTTVDGGAHWLKVKTPGT